MKIDLLTAKKMTLDFLNRLSTEPEGVPYVLLESLIREDEDGWYFPYQSASFVLTGNFGDSLIGNWPIFVSQTGNYVGPRRPGMPVPTNTISTNGEGRN
jgi:hypothetical protein